MVVIQYGTSPEDIARVLLQAKAVMLNPKEPYTFASGIKSPIYCDNRKLLSHPRERGIISNAYAFAASHCTFDVVGGVATAGIAWASLLARFYDKPMIYIREKPKDHGRKNRIEGELQEGQLVLIVEDLVSTGMSSVSAVRAVREAGGRVTDCVAIFTYEMASAQQAFQDAQCSLHPLCSFSTLVREAAQSGYISEKEMATVMAWNKSPETWQP